MRRLVRTCRSGGFSIAGNMLAGAAVLDETAKAMSPAKSCRSPALNRGDAVRRSAGGDKRGKQSAALLIHGDEEWSDLGSCASMTTPTRLAELERLEAVSRERWVHFRPFLPNPQESGGVTDREAIDAGIEAGIARQGSSQHERYATDRNRGLARHLPRDDGRSTPRGRSRRPQCRKWRNARAGRRIGCGKRA